MGVQHVGLAGKQPLVPAAHTLAGGVGEEERAVQAEGRGLVIRTVLVRYLVILTASWLQKKSLHYISVAQPPSKFHPSKKFSEVW